MSSSERALARSRLLWEEYRYRHDLVWQRTFTFTTAIVLIAILPYLQQEVARLLEGWILIAPLLAVCLAGFALLVMLNELRLFSQIKCVYRGYQNVLYAHLHPGYEGQRVNCSATSLRYWLRHSSFNRYVTAYFGSLLLLSAANCFIVWLVWIPGLLGPAADCRIWLL